MRYTLGGMQLRFRFNYFSFIPQFKKKGRKTRTEEGAKPNDQPFKLTG